MLNRLAWIIASLLVASGCDAESPESDRELSDDPASYVAAFLDAWQRGDRNGAERYASPEVVSLAFKSEDRIRDGEPVCLRAFGNWTCEVVTEAGLSFNLSVTRAMLDRREPQAISGVARWGAGTPGQASPSNNYGRALMKAWRVGNKDVALLYATEQAVDELFGNQPPPGLRLAEQSRTGHVWRETWHSADVTVRLVMDTMKVSKGHSHAVQSILVVSTRG